MPARNRSRKKRIRPRLPLDQQRELVIQINEYRQQNAGLTIQQAIDALGLDLNDSNYYSYASRTKNMKNTPVTQEFPLALIPERPKTIPKPIKSPFPKRLQVDEDKRLAAQLLEVAVALLKR